MKRHYLSGQLGVIFLMAVFYWGIAPPPADSATVPPTPATFADVRSSGIPDINGWPNWANSPPLRKFVDDLPGFCNNKAGTLNAAGINALGQCIPVAVPNTTLYPGSDYYEIEVGQYREQLHSDLPSGGSLLRGYRQTFNTTSLPGLPADQNHPIYTYHYLGLAIIAQKDRPVRFKFTNKLPIDSAGIMPIPTDTTVMGSGPGPLSDRPWITAETARTAADPTDAEICNDTTSGDPKCFAQNRATIHLHGGRTPWISDGTAHQWITPAGEYPGGDIDYSKGVSVAYVPDMWFNADGNTIPSCAGKTTCPETGATNNPGNGAQTYYYTNAQSARLMFYHEHAWGITRLGVYLGLAAPYIVTDDAEGLLATALAGTTLASGALPSSIETLPLVIQDKTFVNADTNSPTDILKTDPTWIWGSTPGTLSPWNPGPGPQTGDLWWPHVYVPAQNPFQDDGINDFGRWHYGPWFWPPTDVAYPPKENPYYTTTNNQPPQIPDIPNPSWGAEAFLDTPVINGTAYPKLTVDPTKLYRFRILNGAHDRFVNLQLYVAENTFNFDVVQPGFPTGPVQQLTEVKMVNADPLTSDVGDPGGILWPGDGREGGVPDPATRGPAMVQIGTEGGLLPAPVTLPNRPINWNVDPTTFTAGLVLQQNEGGGTLMLGPAERADVIVDFSRFAGKTLILYNDAPAPWPALDPHYDYFTNSPIYSDIGGAPAAYAGATTPTPQGYGPNTRTLMKIVVSGSGGIGTVNAKPDLTVLNAALTGPAGIFAKYQEPIIVGQSAYNANYGQTFPTAWPNWGLSRIIDNSISFQTTSGGIVTAYPMEPKAIQDEMGEVFDEFGRMSAKLGLEMARTTAGIQTFILQNFVDPPTEIVAKDQVQIWKITHNGVDTHPVHFHLFEVQLLNRVGWDGFIYRPDPNELGWKDTIRVSPLQDTIVALRPAKIPTPFNVPNSLRPLNPAYPLGAADAGFTNLDPVTGELRTTPVTNEVINFGHEYLWHCHILSHEEQDMMRVIVSNANSLLYTDNEGDGFWQWNRGDWSKISTANPTEIVSSGTYAYAKTTNGLWQSNGYDWKQINPNNPDKMIAVGTALYVTYPSYGLYKWDGDVWTQLHTSVPNDMVASDSAIYATYPLGLYKWDGGVWSFLHPNAPINMTAAGTALYATYPFGLYKWDGGVWTHLHPNVPNSFTASGAVLYATYPLGLYQLLDSTWTSLNPNIPDTIVASGAELYANFGAYGLYKWGGTGWTFIHPNKPELMVASGSVLYANYPLGLYKYELGSWTSLFGAPGALAPATLPVSMVAGF